ncbi:MAG: sigma-70 family RNA polymerase sigma factor [Bacteroidota bacterium]
MPSDPSEVTRLLGALNAGDDDALDRLFPLVYAELRRLAASVRQGPSLATMNTTALVHEAYLRLADGDLADFEGRGHFLGVAAKAMRHVLVDHARRRSAQKRGGDLARVDLTAAVSLASSPDSDATVLALDRALDRLAMVDERKARVVECRFFGDLSVEETASALGVSAPTVKRDWRMAQAWLYRALSDTEADTDHSPR